MEGESGAFTRNARAGIAVPGNRPTRAEMSQGRGAVHAFNFARTTCDAAAFRPPTRSTPPHMRSTTLPRAAATALSIVASTILATPAAAQLAPGSTLTFTGSANATELGSPGVFLEFLAPVTLQRAGTTRSFSPLVRPGQTTTASLGAFVVGAGPQSVPGLLQVGASRFDLTALPSGRYGQDECYVMPEVGQQCTPFQFPSYELSPFYLQNRATPGADGLFTALIAFDVAGTVTTRGVTQAFFGTITSTFVGASFQEALAGLEATGLQGVPFTGRFVVGAPARPALGSPALTVTPEPGTVMLVATGLLGVAGVAARRRGATRG